LQHLPLNGYLHCFQRMGSARCPACGHKKETIVQFLLHCTKYAFERWALAEQAKKIRKELTIEMPLGDPEMAIPLENYVDSTGQLPPDAAY